MVPQKVLKATFNSGKVEGACQKDVIFPYLECCSFYKNKVSISLFLVCFGSWKIIDFNKWASSRLQYIIALILQKFGIFDIKIVSAWWNSTFGKKLNETRESSKIKNKKELNMKYF